MTVKCFSYWTLWDRKMENTLFWGGGEEKLDVKLFIFTKFL